MSAEGGELDPAQREAVRGFLDRSQRGEAESVADFVASNGFLDEVMRSVLARLDEGGSHQANESADPRARFEIQRSLGSGGMGTVQLAWDKTLQRLVALKHIRADLVGVAEARRRFELEARAASALSHPNLCPVFDVGEQDGLPFIVMPYVEGKTLAEVIAVARDAPSGSSIDLDTKVSRGITRAVELMETIAIAMHHAHEQGLVHRDLKPGNVMIRPDGSPVVLDFGLVHDDGGAALTRSGVQPGTREYMAPEQVRPRGRGIDRRVDVWALGVILYECLTQRRPFAGDSEHDLFQAILAARPTSVRRLNRRVPRDLAVVLETALAPEPERRYPTALALADDLRRVRQFEPITTRRASVGLRAARFCRREPWAAATLGAVALALGVVFVLFRSADTNLRRFDALSQITRLGDAERIARELVPATPAMASALRAWLAEFGAPLLDLRARIGAEIEELKAALPADAKARRARAEGVLLESLEAARPALDAFAAPGGLLESVGERLAWAESVERLSVDLHRDAWDRTIASIRDPDGVLVHDAYRGLTIAPQVGLVPLGPDPHSRLCEFYDLRTADPALPIPERDPTTHQLTLADGAGIVFVLVPTIESWIGVQKSDPNQPCFDPDYDSVAPNEDLPRRVTLRPFFLAKHELTQSQWSRLGDANPSTYRSGLEDPLSGERIGPRNPVESISWTLARDWLSRFGLRFPTNDEWELACRANTTTVYSFGNDRREIARFGNVMDATYVKFSQPGQRFVEQEVGGVMPNDDKYVMHAPVGSFAPNAYGFFDVHGNVGEWTAEGQDPSNRFVRGGMCDQRVEEARCWLRRAINLDASHVTIGLRAARDVHPLE